MNFKKVIKKYKSLKCPDGYFDPTKLPYYNDKYFVICSERSVGKTTNVLLFAMSAHLIEGKQIVYVRQTSDMIERRNLRQLFNTIKDFNYIEKVTDGKWHDLLYQSHGWYYVNYDADGEIIDRDTDPFMICLSVDQNELYKSTLNTNADIIIFDEMISRRYFQDEFISWCDICKTVWRSRDTGFAFMLSNTIDRNSQYFYEMELNDIINSLPIGASAETVTQGGTPIYVELFSPGQTPERTKLNKLYFGFKNKKLGAITGKDWSLTPMPHPTADDTREILTRRFYILYEDRLVNVELCRTDNDGLHAIAHFSTKPLKELKKDCIIYSLGLMLDWRYRYKFGHNPADKMLWTLYERKKFFYTSNAVGAVVDKYYQSAKDYRRLY